MPSKFYYELGGERVGPIGGRELRQKVAEGLVTPETLLWCEGQDRWFPARKVVGLFDGPGQPRSAPKAEMQQPPASQPTATPRPRSRRVAILAGTIAVLVSLPVSWWGWRAYLDSRPLFTEHDLRPYAEATVAVSRTIHHLEVVAPQKAQAYQLVLASKGIEEPVAAWERLEPLLLERRPSITEFETMGNLCFQLLVTAGMYECDNAEQTLESLSAQIAAWEAADRIVDTVGGGRSYIKKRMEQAEARPED